MKYLKKIWKNTLSRVWLVVTAVVLALMIVVNVLVSSTFYATVCTFLGEPAVKLTGEENGRFATKKEFDTKEAALANANKVAKEICEEGFTLLKNKDNRALPLKEGAKVSVFGKNSVDMAIGGSGSGGSVGADSKDIFESLTRAGFQYNDELRKFYEDGDLSGKGRDSNPTDLDSGKPVELSEGETPIANYTQNKNNKNYWDTCNGYKDAALIVITRIGGEGFDMPRQPDGSHFLQLSRNEKDLINEVEKQGFDKVILLLNAASTLELKDVEEDDGVDAILWIGYAGGEGLLALGELLRGKTLEGDLISPSGKTVDTYAADFTHNPTWENMGAALGTVEGEYIGDQYLLKKGDSYIGEEAYFVDYEESIYVGYRYYETAYAESVAGNYDGFDYDEEVVYPFGFGLSYTKFSWTLENAGDLSDVHMAADTSLTFRVKVTNVGEYPGKDTVQIYVTPRYNPGGLEKSAKVLVGFAKTKTLAPGQSDTVEITIDSPYDFASYDYLGLSGTEGYVVEKGDYAFTVSENAHSAKVDPETREAFAPVVTKVDNNIVYGKDPVTGTVVANLYTGNEDASLNSDEELGIVLSRKDFEGTWPKLRTPEERSRFDSDWMKNIKTAPSVTNRPESDDKMPDTGVNHGIKLSDLVGVDYDGARVLTEEDTPNALLVGKTCTEAWDMFLDQLTVAEMKDLINKGSFKTIAISRLMVPQTINADGPVGFCNFLGGTSVYDTCKYPCEVVIASTWNIDKLTEMGRAVGNEALVGDSKHGGTPYTGWYAPGLNIHRTPFGGRNFEYYSEDSFLSGKMTAAIMEGCYEKGVYVNMKHFALNEQETHRSANGLLTWATEQSIRELYLKPFEIAVKTAKADGVKSMGVMSSFNRIGERWTGGDYRLLTTILREEWGFEGLVICDFNTCGHMNVRDMVYAGGDLNLEMAGFRIYSPDAKDATDVTVFRQASKNILYTVANSNAIRGDFTMAMPTWQVIMIVIDCAVAAGLAVWGFFAIRRAIRSNKDNGDQPKKTVN